MSLREKCMNKVRDNIQSLPPTIKDEILEVCREDMTKEINEQLRIRYGMNRMRAALPGIVNDVIMSRSFGFEQVDHLEDNPGIDKLLLDHVLLAIELTIEATSSYPWANSSGPSGEYDSVSEHDDSVSDHDDY